MIKHNHPFHIVEIRPWPITTAMGILIITSGIIQWFHYSNYKLLIRGLLITRISAIQWWRDIYRERTLQGLHLNIVNLNLRWGIILFIISEVLFFFSFFWAFFHRRLAPSVELGNLWPPVSVYSFNPFQIPLLNSIVLLRSGVTVSWAHHSLINKNQIQATLRLFLTILLGIYFTTLQVYEYYAASFSISDNVYGSSFFVATGFHGLHVIIGSLFLSYCFSRLIKGHFSRIHHFGFEAAIWYWHFVDVIWLLLYASIYWWNSM